MFSLLNNKKIRGWCLFDFGISSYPTLILTFFYGAFYANTIATNSLAGTSNWGFAISISSIFTFLILSFLLIQGRQYYRNISSRFFLFFYYLLILSTCLLSLFGEGSNEFYPLIIIVFSFISFEIITLFYNVSLYKVSKKNQGFVSSLGWAFGYLGGLLSLLIIYLLIKSTQETNFLFKGISVFLLIGPLVGLWTFIFGSFLFKELKTTHFEIPDLLKFYENIRRQKLTRFLFSYFFFNNGVISIFAFASLFASFLFKFTESEILFLGVFINLSGILGCLFIGYYENRIGSEKSVIICSLILFLLSLGLYFIESSFLFWVIAILIGFFIGPIQALSRAVIVKKIKAKNQLAAFSFYSVLGNICAILGPLTISLVVDMNESIRMGVLVIPVFFIVSLIPYIKTSV